MKLLAPSISVIAGLATAQVSCPTITTTSLCSTCAVPLCLALSTVSVPCGCDLPVPTSVVSEPCNGVCSNNGCGATSWATELGACPSSACPTITSTVRQTDCLDSGGVKPCVEPDCARVEEVPVPCSCVASLPLPTKTVSICGCRTGCATFSMPEYLPCPMTVPSPTATAS